MSLRTSALKTYFPFPSPVLFIWALIVLCSVSTFAQDDPNKKKAKSKEAAAERLDGQVVLTSNGTVVDESGKRLEGVTIKMYELNRNDQGEESYSYVDKGTTTKEGIISISLDLNKEYVLVFSKKGFVRKKIWFDTHVKPPLEELYLFDYDLILSQKPPDDLDPALMDKPIVKIYFKSERHDFAYDSLYLANLKAKLRSMRPQDKEKMRNVLLTGVDEQIDETGSEVELSTKQNDDQYKLTIAKADQAAAAQDFTRALDLYNEAMALAPSQPYPPDKINEINEMLKGQQNYDKLIADANKLFDEKNYADAKTKYKEANKLRPTDPYPLKRIGECDDLMYKQLIANGDKLFNEKKYADARFSYAAALDVKENEQYPKDRIAEIDRIINKDKLEKQYNELMSAADALFAEADKTRKNAKGENDYANAKKLFLQSREKYVEAGKLMPEQKRPKDRILEIDRILEELNKKVDQEKEYNDLITQADIQFNQGNNMPARAMYTDALKLKPKEKYPKDQIAKIDELVQKLDHQVVVENKYDALIKKANNYFDYKDYQKARKSYQDALALRPKEEYPKQRIKEIDEMNKQIAEVLKVEDKYADVVAKADAALDRNDFKKALELYKEANKIKPNEDYPPSMIQMLEDILSGKEQGFTFNGGVGGGGNDGGTNPAPTNDDTNAEKKARYTTAVASGDKNYGEGKAAKDKSLAEQKYNQAIIDYKNALEQMPNEQYPIDMIKKIKEVLRNGSAEKSTPPLVKNDKDTELEKEIKEARLALQRQVELFEKTKQGNLSTKYETKNPLTTLYDQVDAYNAERKNKPTK